VDVGITAVDVEQGGRLRGVAELRLSEATAQLVAVYGFRLCIVHLLISLAGIIPAIRFHAGDALVALWPCGASGRYVVFMRLRTMTPRCLLPLHTTMIIFQFPVDW